jgi:phenylpyruvate tautomerase PptA (4-oxalocrotonate tautomerase family)
MLKASIFASGTAREGEVDGQKAKIVEAVTKVHSVDWVTEAGAGGQALSLAEAANGAPPPEGSTAVAIQEVTPAAPTALSREAVEALLAEAGLVADYRRPLLLATYTDAAAVTEAAQAMKAAMREAGAGAPFGIGAGRVSAVPTTTAAERERKALRSLGIGQQG